MIEIAVLKTAEDKNMREESIDIPEFGCRVRVIFVPFKRKVKRRIRVKLTKILINYAYVLAENEKLTAYEKSRSFKSLFYIDIEGHKDDEIIAKALNSARQSGHEIRVLGSYAVAK